MTVIQPNEFRSQEAERYRRDGELVRRDGEWISPPQDEELIPSLTGIGQLADRLIGRIAAAKVRTEAANTKVEQAFVKLDSAAVVLERVAEKAEAEADAAIARIGQVSNMAPE